MKSKNKLFLFLSCVLWIAIWKILSVIIDSPLLLPSPFDTLLALIGIVREKEFLSVCFYSIRNVFFGVAAGALMGFVLACLSKISKTVRYLFLPLLSTVKAIPVASFIILLLVWIGKEYVPSAVSMLMVTPVIYSNIFEGLQNISIEQKEVCKIYKIGFKKRAKILYIPSIMPYLMSGLKTSIGLSWKAGIASEVLCTPQKSIGINVYNSKIYLETSNLFAWTVTILILSFIFEKLCVIALNRICERRDINVIKH